MVAWFFCRVQRTLSTLVWIAGNYALAKGMQDAA